MKIKFQDSLFYQIYISEKIFKSLFEQFFKEINIGINATEHLALTIIEDTKDCCQRDLAKILFKDRAGTGKLANILKTKGLIKIELKTKNNRPVRILTLTEKGIEILKKTSDIGNKVTKKIQEKFSKETMEQAKTTLMDFRETVKDALKNKI